jgi:predicted esterase
MSKKMVVFVLGALCILWAGLFCSAQTFSSYQDMRKQVGELFQQKDYEKAAGILELHLESFPEHVKANSYNLALMYVMLKDFPNSLKALGYGLDHGIWFGKYDFFAEIWNPLKQAKGYDIFMKNNDGLWQEAQKSVKPKLEIKVPEDFSVEKSYPLFIALHGGNENLETFVPRWTSYLLQKDFIVAYPQSSQLVSMNGFSWSEDEDLTLKEIRMAYEAMTEKYSIDAERIVIGGFSSGGQASLSAVLHDTVPVAGFVVLCPPRPEDFDLPGVEAMQKRGIRGTILTTEMDPRLKDQEAMSDLMKSAGLQLEFIVTPNTGHWYPDDLAEKIDSGLMHVLSRGGK